MEAGKTVVLLNLENLYESLYDALNQVMLSRCLLYSNYAMRPNDTLVLNMRQSQQI